MIKALRSPNVYAVHCSITPEEVVAGILILNEDFEPGTHTLWHDDQAIAVEIPEGLQVRFKATLRRVVDHAAI